MRKKSNEELNGVTMHYERTNEGKWFVVWSADFPGDDPGRNECDDHDSMLLEIGYSQCKADMENNYPIKVDGESIDINTNAMEIGKLYPVRFLNEDLIYIRTGKTTVEILAIADEETRNVIRSKHE